MRDHYADLWSLTSYTSTIGITQDPLLGSVFGFVEDVISSFDIQEIPEGWREINHSELGLDSSVLDSSGYYSGLSGLASMDGQVRIFGKFDGGEKPTDIAVAFRGTNGLRDVAAYIENLDGFEERNGYSYVNSFDYVLNAVKDYALANGLTGSDVSVTGYSLGGAAVNDMYGQRETSWDGFYESSLFFGNAPCFVKEGEGILNFGFENDTVHRAWLDGEGVVPALKHALKNQDPEFDSSTDNMVLFSDVYAHGLHAPFGAFSWFDPLSWEAHIGAAAMNPIEIIGGSNFYDEMSEDSRVVISNLLDATQGSTWVWDKDSPSTKNADRSEGFVLGTDSRDLIRDRAESNDFLDGFDGDDLFKISGGNDVVHGGAGHDKVKMSGRLDDYHIERSEDGTVYLYDKSGKNGLNTLIDVEEISFRPFLFEQSYDITEGGLVGSSFWTSNSEHSWDANVLETYQVI
ncbi:MAG: hypothetical protein ABW120_05115 [Sedimenticola sp.]